MTDSLKPARTEPRKFGPEPIPDVDFEQKLPEGWKRYPPAAYFHPGAIGFYQKRLYHDNDDHRVSMEVIVYVNGFATNYVVELHVPSELSITGMTINVNIFTYDTLDLARMEMDARSVLSRLMNVADSAVV